MSDGIFKEESWAKLERPERLSKLNPEESLRFLGLGQGHRFADLGSGTGVFVFPALTLVGEDGVVYAVERSQKLIDRMLDKVTPAPDNLKIVMQDLTELNWTEAGVDRALLSHVAHELPNLKEFLTRLRHIMAPGGRLAVIEWRVMEQEQGPPLHKRISQADLRRILQEAGWTDGAEAPLGEDNYILTATL